MNYKGFHHLTWNDRLTIEKMLKVHTAKAKIAEALGVSVRTITMKSSAECARNGTQIILLRSVIVRRLRSVHIGSI